MFQYYLAKLAGCLESRVKNNSWTLDNSDHFIELSKLVVGFPRAMSELSNLISEECPLETNAIYSTVWNWVLGRV